MQPNTIDEAFTLYDDTEIVFGNGRFRTLAVACRSPRCPANECSRLSHPRRGLPIAPLSSQRVFTESSTGFERGSLSPMYLGRPEGLQVGRKDVAESGIRTEIQTGIHQHARSQNVPMITMQWFVVVCAPPAPTADRKPGAHRKSPPCPISNKSPSHPPDLRRPRRRQTRRAAGAAAAQCGGCRRSRRLRRSPLSPRWQTGAAAPVGHLHAVAIAWSVDQFLDIVSLLRRIGAN
jgi:hypothetical protein